MKGPTAKIMSELDITPDALGIARHYGDLIDGFVLDRQDEHLADRFSVGITVAQTLMRTLEDKVDLARTCLALCDQLARRGAAR